jgi:hypothetical protein
LPSTGLASGFNSRAAPNAPPASDSIAACLSLSVEVVVKLKDRTVAVADRAMQIEQARAFAVPPADEFRALVVVVALGVVSLGTCHAAVWIIQSIHHRNTTTA